MAAVLNGIGRIVPKNSRFIRKISTNLSVSDVIKKGADGENKKIQGWVTAIRKMKDVVFVDINDGSCAKNLQVVFPKTNRPAALTNGSSIEATGRVSVNQNGQIELKAEEIGVVGTSDTVRYPFSAKQNHSHDYSRQYLHFRPQLPYFKSLLRVRHKSMLIVHDWFDSNDFCSIHTPILTCNDCEGAGEVFKVLPVSQALVNEMKKKGQSDSDAFFGNPAFLSVSGQLHLEAISRCISKVYSLSPTFRAENSKSRLHLSEFYMLESEESFISDLDQILDTMESFVKYAISKVILDCREELEVLCKYDSVDPALHIGKLQDLAEKKFVKVTFEDASRIVESQFKTNRCQVEGFSKEHEHFLVEHFGSPVFVVDWPNKMKPFYMKAAPGNPDLVSAVDLLVPNVGELCGGSLREDDHDLLHRKLTELKLVDSMQWYLDLRRFGNVPTGGFGMGFERFLQLVTGLTNIKDTIPFPRWPHSLKM